MASSIENESTEPRELSLGPAAVAANVDGSLSGWEPKRLFHQLADGGFEECAFAEGFDSRADGRSIALADFDGDGRQDLLLVNRAKPELQLFHNQGPNGNAVELSLVGTQGHPEADGAVVYVRGVAYPVVLARGYMTSVDPTVHVGLGEATHAQVEVAWLRGPREDFGAVQAGARYRLVEGSGKAVRLSVFSPPSASGQPGPLTLSALVPDAPPAATVVALFASWCKPCWAEVAPLNALYREGKWRVVGLAYHPAAVVRGVAKQMRLEYPAEAVGAREAALAAFGLTDLPALLVFDASGTLVRVVRDAAFLGDAL